MSVVKPSYGAVTALTITLNGLASAAGATSAAIVQTTDLALDNLVEVIITAGTIGANAFVSVYAVPSVDGTNYGDLSNAPLIGSIAIVVSNGVYRKTMSVAQAFGGNLPPAYEIYCVNNTGGALAATGNSIQFREVNATVV